MSVTLEAVIEQVRALEPDDRERLREWLDSWQTKPIHERIAEADRRLLARGVVGRVPPPIADFTPYENRETIPHTGRPVSETMIEERR